MGPWPGALAVLFCSHLGTTATTGVTTTTTAATAAASSGNISLQLLRTVVNASNLDYAVESRVYTAEAPDLLFVTHRASPPHASISVFDLAGGMAAMVAASKAAVAGGGGSGGSGGSGVGVGGVGGGGGGGVGGDTHAMPPLPTLRARWVGQSVEGQDRRGDLLVVTALGNRASNGSKLLLFNASEAAAGSVPAGLLGGGGPFATLPLSFDGALHVKIYVQQSPPPAATTASATTTAATAPRSARVYAIITAGLTSAAGADRTLVAAVDITDPARPAEVARTSTACKCAEGVAVVPGGDGGGGGGGAIDVAFIGSYCSNEVATLDLSQLPAAMPQLRSRSDPGYENMVSAVRNSSYQAARRRPLQQQTPPPPPPPPPPPRRLLYSASYASPGGLVIFDADAMGRQNGSVVEVGRAIALPSSRANRVHLSADGRFALLALEKSPPAPGLPNGTTAAPAPETGGVAVVDIRDPASPVLVAVARVPDNASRAYCLATREASGPGGGLLVFLFGATAEAMYTYLLSGYAYDA